MNTACDHLLDREQLVTPVEAGDGVGGVGAAQRRRATVTTSCA
jgi:hypothetical protein